MGHQAASEGRADPAVRLAAIESLVDVVLDLYGNHQDSDTANDDLAWRQACDDAYTDGILARKCGLDVSDHGLSLDTEHSRALAQAFGLGWSVADESAAFDEIANAARMLLKFGTQEARDDLREAFTKLPRSIR